MRHMIHYRSPWQRGVTGYALAITSLPTPRQEKAAARELAAKAVRLNTGDALAESMLAAGYTLAHDLEAAAVHAKRALALDGGCAWAWGRSAWVLAYAGRAQRAIEEFQIARSLAPADPLNFLWSVGIASAEFQTARYSEFHSLVQARICRKSRKHVDQAVSRPSLRACWARRRSPTHIL